MIQRTLNGSHNKQWKAFVLVIGTLMLMAFYTLSDPLNLSHDHLLNGGDWLGGAVCHRIIDRSFMINGRSFPLCARCTGMYLGVAIVFTVLFLANRLRWSQLPPLPVLFFLVGFIGVMGIDGLNSFSHFIPNFPHIYEPRNWLRLVTGVGTGLAMGLFAFPILAQTLWRNDQMRPVIGSFRELGLVLLVALTAVLLLLSNQPAISYVLAIASVFGLLLIVTSLNAILWLTLLRKEGQAVRWRETAVSLTISLFLAIGELSTLSLLRLHFFGSITGIPGL
jgi:uncharacterized membrane protein